MVTHKNPTDRAHLWDRAPRANEFDAETAPIDHEYPRYLHRGAGTGAESRLVRDASEERAAEKQGFTRDVQLTKDQQKAVRAAQRPDDTTTDDAHARADAPKE